MRFAAVALLALLLAPPADADDGGELVFRIENHRAQAQHVTIEVQDAEGRVESTREFEAPPGVSVTPLPASLAYHYAHVVIPNPANDPLAKTLGVSWGVNMEECARSIAGFEVYDGAVLTSAADTGCHVAPPLLAELVAQARDPAAGLGSIRVPEPSLGDKALFRASSFLGEPDWPNATNLTLTWRDRVEFPDSLGGTTRGAEARFAFERTFTAGSTLSAFDQQVPLTESRVSNQTEIVRYRSGEAEPLAFSFTSPGATASFTASSSLVTRSLYYGPTGDGLACLFRFAAQGRTIRAGDELPAADVCAELSHGAPWRAGATQERDGLVAIPLHAAVESTEGTFAARVWLADGVPYPLEIVAIHAPVEKPVSEAAYRLFGFAGDGAPLDATPPAPSEAPTLSQLDPLRGPALGEAGARFPFRLDEAAGAAMVDPTLTRLRSLVAEGGVLAGANLRTTRDSTTGASVLTWSLVYSSPSSQAVVECERLALSLVVAPAARCKEMKDWEVTLSLRSPPRMSAADLPPATISWGDAVERWALADPDARGEPVTSATWRAWQPVLALGRGFADPLAPVAPTTSTTSLVALDPVRATTIREVVGVERTSGLASLPEVVAPRGALSAAAPAPTGGFPASIAAVGAGVAILALVALAVLLYTRLVKRDVLDSQTRQRIVDAVRDSPGIHASGILERVGKAHGVGEYHLGVLVREGFLTAIESPGFRRYFVTGRFSHTEMRALAALQDGQNEKLFRIIQANPGIQVSELAQRAGISLPYASRTVKKLHEAGLVDRVEIGRTVSLHAIEK